MSTYLQSKIDFVWTWKTILFEKPVMCNEQHCIRLSFWTNISGQQALHQTWGEIQIPPSLGNNLISQVVNFFHLDQSSQEMTKNKNSTPYWDQEAITDVSTELFEPTLEKDKASLVFSLTCLVLVFGFLVQRSVFQLLKRKSGRAVNKIILYQQVS